jgi:putative nucleotidyltransferase with HDIG domain
MQSLVERASKLAETLVAPLDRRWSHVRAVAAKARDLAALLPDRDGEHLVAAAWLHDIGYAPDVRRTGFHALDGARYLRAHYWPSDVVNAVAHHSGARFEAEQRQLSHELAEFPLPQQRLLDALCTADLTTGPSGEDVTYNDRVDEILQRYSSDDPVHKTWIRARPVLNESLQRIKLGVHPR